MNNWFNFQIPFFNEQFGTDWDSFKTIVDSNVDNIMCKTFDLYKIHDVTMKPVRALELSLNLRGIVSEPLETVNIKRQKLRSYNKDFRSKSMKDTYLDYQESIVGIRGEIYNGYTVGTFVWNISNWHTEGGFESTDRIWSTEETKFNIYINCKTTDSNLLDEILLIYRQSFLLPAFYQVFLVDDELNILRTV
jgi:hypothetical protein